jgi:transposase
MKMYFVVVVVSFDFNLETFLKKKTTKQKKNLMNEKTNFSKLAGRKKKISLQTKNKF